MLSPVAMLVTVKMLFAIAAIKGWYLFQLDVNNAFSSRDLFDNVRKGEAREGT